ncbi:MAG: hypothetical protein DMG96_24755 [Acidobacteria bacterium]|nr:MAG: hypothetical protein DMG96_24755 [Acidobacteriota bacterium]
MKRNLFATAALGMIASVSVGAQQPPPLRLNVPYNCPGNMIVVVKHCEKRGGAEVCSLVKGAPNGPMGDEISMPKAQAAALGLMCTTQGGPAAQGGNTPAASSDYTNDLPSVERVKAEIKGSDPTDALARQVAVFTYLVSYIDRIKYNRTVDGPFSPGEQKMMGAYRLAAYQMSQDFAKTHAPAEAAAFERLHGQYEMNGVFYKDWSTRLIGPQSAAAYKGAEAGLAASGQKHYEQEMADYKRDSAAQQAADKQIFGTQGLSNDPTAVATRRCLELGGSSAGCVGKGFMSGFKDLIGFTPEAEEELTGPGKAGVVLSGLYKNPATVTTLGFGESGVTIGGCGKLVDDSHGYTIDKRPSSARVTVDNEPNPIVLTMRPDGGLTGPGLIDVKGRIIVGYHTVTSTLMINGVPATPDQCNGPCQTSTRVPDYAPAMGRCSIGSLAMPPSPKPAPATAQPAKDSGITSLVTGLADMLSPGGGAPIGGGGGLRMTGKYSDGRLLLDFSGNSLILDCGQAHVRQPYAVENAPNTFVIHVQNSGGPFTLALEPDNSLRGAGSTSVNGRLVTGMNGDDVAFAPHSESCEVGTFRPKTGATAATSVATATPAPAPVMTPATPVSGSTAAGGAGMNLAISTSFPGGANPLAGKGVTLMSERFDTLLRKIGAPIAAKDTPGRAAAEYSANCLPPKSCPGYAAAMHPYYVGKGTFDSTGNIILTVPVPAGTYFVFCSAVGPDGPLIWDVPTKLNAGDNTVTLTAGNAELIH